MKIVTLKIHSFTLIITIVFPNIYIFNNVIHNDIHPAQFGINWSVFGMDLSFYD